ncbi:MAG: riboflavin synthase [Elusimicrobia bacterium CG06_land_8_20_14_3_00_38_11]|nr:MAG: riboflavin synthase [Elusimicrobia bacterium CG06_land_8_20_14_3_00_38_11]
MFTGIIEDLGTVKKISKTQITVETKLDDIKIGDSVSVNGVCLTVINRSLLVTRYSLVTFDISEETFKKTNLGKLKIGIIVNLERALKSGGRLGGHFVTGHIDGVGKILRISLFHNSRIVKFSNPENLTKYITEKGSVAMDGISLTIAEKKVNSFSAAIIPHTLKNTTLGIKKVGDTVNIETDILAKYVLQQKEKNKITFETLKKAGFYD